MAWRLSLIHIYACDLYKEVVSYGVEAGADLVLIETMSDGYEAKAAVLAAKESCDLPVFATMIFDSKGKLDVYKRQR